MVAMSKRLVVAMWIMFISNWIWLTAASEQHPFQWWLVWHTSWTLYKTAELCRGSLWYWLVVIQPQCGLWYDEVVTVVVLSCHWQQ